MLDLSHAPLQSVLLIHRRYFKNLDFCFRTTGWDDLELDIHEEKPIIGPCWGCAEGCFSYWFCCKGMRALFCANDRQASAACLQGVLRTSIAKARLVMRAYICRCFAMCAEFSESTHWVLCNVPVLSS